MRQLRLALPTLALVGLLPVAGLAHASERSTFGLEIESHTRCHLEPADFALTATFWNVGDTPVIALPALIRREYFSMGDGVATYQPHPAPPISAWQDAVVVPARGSRSIEFPGMRDRNGVWRLAPGHYRVLARYSVEPDLEKLRPEASALEPELRGVPLWQGELRSETLDVLFDPQFDSTRRIDFTWPDPCVRRAILRELAGIERVPEARAHLESRGFSCELRDEGPLTRRKAVVGRHLHCTRTRGGRVVTTWHVGVIAVGDEVIGVVVMPERIHM